MLHRKVRRHPYLLLLLPKRNENYLCCAKEREKREGSCSSCSNFFQKQEHFLPSGVARVLTTRFVCACLACPSTVETLALFRFDQQQQQHPASQILTGNGAPHATRVAWLYYAARPAPRAGRSYGRPCVDRKAKRLADSTSATAKKGAVPVRRLAASASNRHEKEKAGSTKTKRGVCDVPIGGETLTITHRGHVSPTVLLFLGVG